MLSTRDRAPSSGRMLGAVHKRSFRAMRGLRLRAADRARSLRFGRDDRTGCRLYNGDFHGRSSRVVTNMQFENPGPLTVRNAARAAIAHSTRFQQGAEKSIYS